MSEMYYKSSRGSNKSLNSYTNLSSAKQPKILDNGTSVRMSPVYYVLLIILLIVLIASLINNIRGVNQNITFTYFLEYLSTSPSIQFKALTEFTIPGSWGVFDFFRILFNSIGLGIGVSIWVCQLIFNVFSWLWWAFKFFFV